ncbi:unnamed protein product, partial [Prorocentrum cordatum]
MPGAGRPQAAAAAQRRAMGPECRAERARRARRSVKAWARAELAAVTASEHDAVEAGVDVGQALYTVRHVVRVATAACAALSALKLAVYWQTGSAVILTSALGSLGDLAATCVARFAARQVARQDRATYPAGRAKFEPAAVALFAAFMATIMFANALGNVKEVSEIDEAARERAVRSFWSLLMGGQGETWSLLQRGRGESEPPAFQFKPGEGSLNGTFDADTWLEANANMQETIDYAGFVVQPFLESNKAWTAIALLSCCAVLKFGLWFYCV